MTVKEIRAIAEKYTDLYEIVAIRTQEEEFELGEMLHNSHVWDDGDETEEEIDGVCATSTDNFYVISHSEEATGMTGSYPGEHQAIICGDQYEIGNDPGEVVIKDAIVVEILA